jgi:hypothetical protein
MAAITLRSVKGSPLTNNEIDANFTDINNEVGTKLNTSAYTAEDVLSKLLTVDTDAAGINASTLLGRASSTVNTANTIVLRDASGNFSAGTITANLTGTVTGSLIGNASTATNGVVTTGSYVNPTWIASLAGSKVTSIPNTSLANSSITINGSSVSLGGSISISGSSNTWTAQQTFRDSLFSITDETDTSKVLNFQLSGISTASTRVLFAPDTSGTIAILESPAFSGAPTVNGIEIGYRHIPQTAISNSYTLGLSDASRHIYHTGGVAGLTVPVNSSVALPIGATITVINNGSGALSITSSATIFFAGTVSSGNRTLATKGLATLIKVGTDTWFISGIGLS